MPELHGCSDSVHRLFSTAMQTCRSLARVWCAISVSSGLCLSLAGCGSSDAVAPSTLSASQLALVQVSTITTVQASSGSFLSPTPEQNVPDYVERAAAPGSALAAEQDERAKVDLALLFRTAEGALSGALAVQGQLSVTGERSPIQHYFPSVTDFAGGASWPLRVSDGAAALGVDVSEEWRGWQGFQGLSVAGSAQSARAPVATLDFELSGLRSPLLLSGQLGNLMRTNRSARTIEHGLLVYCHPGGVGVRVIDPIGPGDRVVTALGPKEHPPEQLLEMARAELSAFFASVATGARALCALPA
ncbi:MAG: hypothetical protein ABW061_10425, partial [Polyangiaceae bacterium]